MVSSEQIVHEALVARIEQLKTQVATLQAQQTEARDALWELATCVNNLGNLVNDRQRETYWNAIARANKLREEMRP